MFLPVGEQLFASAFTFFLFVVAARILAPEALSVYSAYFSLCQSFSFFLMGLVLVPVASSTGSQVDKQLGISVTMLVILLGAFALVSPLAMGLFGSFDGRIGVATWAMAVVFFTSQCLYESARWLTIRLRGARTALPVTVARFALFFGTLFWLGSGRLDGTGFALTQVAANLTATLCYGLRLGTRLRQIEPRLPDRSALRHFATFGNSTATFATNFAAVTLIDRAWGGVGLAAFQTIRSATNPIGLISQVIDNHFSADLARSERAIAFGLYRIVTALAVTSVLVALAIAIAPLATTLVLGESFGVWWPLFPVMLLASLAHAVTRPIFVNWRLADNIRALNLYSVLLICVVMPIMITLGETGQTLAMVVLFAAQPFASFLPRVLEHRAVVAGKART